MQWWEALVLGAVEGFTEFLPISSTGHLTIVEKVLGYTIDDPDVTAFTAIIQIGAVFATMVYFRRDLHRMIRAFARGAVSRAARDRDYRLAVAVLLGAAPIAVVGLVFKDTIETTLRSLWVVAWALLLWSFVMAAADRAARQFRSEEDLTWRDTLIIGIVQCLALVPGISRSGATMSAGLLRGLDRVTVTRLSFFLSLPALSGATVLQAATHYDRISNGVGWTATAIATAVSFVVAYAVVAWLLRFIASHTYTVFIVYRVGLASVLLILLGTGLLEPT